MMMKQILLAGVLGLLAHSVRAGSAIGKMNISSLRLNPSIDISYDYTNDINMAGHEMKIRTKLRDIIQERIKQLIQSQQQKNRTQQVKTEQETNLRILTQAQKNIRSKFTGREFTANVIPAIFKAKDKVQIWDGKTIMDSTVYEISSTNEKRSNCEELVQRNQDDTLTMFGYMNRSKLIPVKCYRVSIREALKTLETERQSQETYKMMLRRSREQRETSDKARADRREERRREDERKRAIAKAKQKRDDDKANAEVEAQQERERAAAKQREAAKQQQQNIRNLEKERTKKLGQLRQTNTTNKHTTTSATAESAVVTNRKFTPPQQPSKPTKSAETPEDMYSLTGKTHDQLKAIYKEHGFKISNFGIFNIKICRKDLQAKLKEKGLIR